MTIVCGITTKQGVYFAADSCASDGNGKQSSTIQKVWEKDGLLWGVSGSYPLAQLLRWKCEFDLSDDFTEEWIVDGFTTDIRKILKCEGLLKQRDGADYFDGSIMVAKHDIYVIHGDFQVNRSIDPYNAIGSGRDIALGYLYACDSELDGEDAVRGAVEAACKFNAFCHGPLQFVSIRKPA